MRLIDAEALMEELKTPVLIDNEKASRIWEGWHECTIALKEAIDRTPTIEERKTGRWIHDGFDHPHGVDWCHCSICGNRESVNSVYTQVDIYPYCAKCGAKMEDENETNR